MNTIDIISLVFIALLILLGIWHGLLRGIFRLAAWAAAIAGAYFANKFFADSVAGFGFSEFSSSIVCICAGFLIPFLSLLFASHMINKAMSDTVAGKVDRVLGGIFGLIKAILILFVMLSILHVMPFGGVVESTRNDATAYALYKSTLESLGYSSEPVDLVGAAERKASEITENLVNKASEKAEEVAKEKVEKATDVAKDAAKEAAKAAAVKAIKATTDDAGQPDEKSIGEQKEEPKDSVKKSK